MILDSCSHSPVGGGVKNLKRKVAVQATSPTATQSVIDLCDDETQLETNMEPVDKKGKFNTLSVDPSSDAIAPEDATEEQFNLEACMNFGKPIMVEWDGKRRPFVDGLGLCSPTRWHPSCRAFHRPTDMINFAEETFKLLEETVTSNIGDVRREAFRLATGNMKASPFGLEVLSNLRHKWSKLLESPG